MRIIILSIAVIFFITGSYGFAQQGGDTAKTALDEKAVKQAANDQLLSFMDKIPAGQEALYGFNNRGEFVNAVTGRLYRVYIFSGLDRSGENKMTPTGEYRVPVIIDHSFRALLTVAQMEGQWRIVDFGACGLAKEFESFENKMTAPEGSTGILLRIYKVSSDFIDIADSRTPIEQCKFYPLQSAINYLTAKGLATGNYYEIDQLLKLF